MSQISDPVQVRKRKDNVKTSSNPSVRDTETQTPKGRIFPHELVDLGGVPPGPAAAKGTRRGKEEVADKATPPKVVLPQVSHHVRHRLLRRVYLLHIAQTSAITGLVHLLFFYRPATKFALYNWWGWIVGALALVVVYAVMMCGPVRWRADFPVNALLLAVYTLLTGSALGFILVDVVKDDGDYRLRFVFLFDPLFAFGILVHLTIVAASCQTTFPLVKTRPLGYLFLVSGTTYKLALIVAEVLLFRYFPPEPPPGSLTIFVVLLLEVATMCYFYVLIILTQYMLEGRFDISLDPRNSVSAMLYMQESALYLVAYYFYFWARGLVYCVATVIKRKHRPRANYVYRKYWGQESRGGYGLQDSESKNTIILR